ncbi:MAG: 2Fe-2S iron-sulfur cluster binding domain-containing protein [Firmicutes bacterium]|nr:2Fe-2S iron-sulfur cluster binding domain-containing protein [Bacillota bacterium]
MPVVTLTIDKQEVQVEPGTSVLEAAKKANVNIPTLCYLKDLMAAGACGVCVVEVQGKAEPVKSCQTVVEEGMVVSTYNATIRDARREALETILAKHPFECLTCIRSLNCELQEMAAVYGIREVTAVGAVSDYPADFSSVSVIRNPAKCIQCQRCVAVCEKVQTVEALSVQQDGKLVAPVKGQLADTNCVNCGQCVLVCPTAAIQERDQTEEVWAAIADPNKHVIVQTAPAVRVAIGEAFGLAPGSVATGQMVAALRLIGFDKVFDTDFTADLTIMEEGSELLERVSKGGVLPLITSCSPGWIKFIEHFYPQLLPHVSTCKSPQQMFGALAKTFYAEKSGIDAKDIFSVSIMPCTAKKFEAQRPEMNSSGYQDVDVVLTTRELARMFKLAGIDFSKLPEENYDDPLGISTGAAVIFGATGGVMEAALRTVYEIVTKEDLPSVDFNEVRGLTGIKEATVQVGDLPVKVAVAHSLGNARKLLDAIVDGKADYHFIEVMCCPGGCIGGGGQPIPTNLEIRGKRIDGIYAADVDLPMRKSHENPAVQQLYVDFLEQPLGHKSHELLHTHYTPRGKN